jgi:hypothetical protein
MDKRFYVSGMRCYLFMDKAIIFFLSLRSQQTGSKPDIICLVSSKLLPSMYCSLSVQRSMNVAGICDSNVARWNAVNSHACLSKAKPRSINHSAKD